MWQVSTESAAALAGAGVPDTLRTCRTCDVAKPLADFRAQVKDGKTYHRGSCRDCEKAGGQKWYRERSLTPPPLDEFATQACRICARVLPLSGFRRQPTAKLGVDARCKKCESEYSREWNMRNADRYYEKHLLRKFGITLSEYEALAELQGGVCAICGELPTGQRNRRRGEQRVFRARLVVDHDHSTGEVRGLLCNNCNAGIGVLNDDPALIRRALNYLERE